MNPHQKYTDPDPDPGLNEHADPDPGHNSWLTQNLKYFKIRLLVFSIVHNRFKMSNFYYYTSVLRFLYIFGFFALHFQNSM